MVEKIVFDIPTSKKEMSALGWERADIILFSGDAFVDHPSFGTAVIARVLLNNGYKVAVVPQPNWQDDLRDFKKLGRPALFFGVNSGVMDSMINHYTANKRRRSNDAYTPDGLAGKRPDYAVTVYTKILKDLFPDVPVVIGGVEASLRRISHYDYWQNALLPSILVDSGADWLVYGMGEIPILEIAYKIAMGESDEIIRRTRQIAYLSDVCDSYFKDLVVLNSYEQCLKDKMSFIDNFNIVERESNSLKPRHIIEPVGKRFIHITPPVPPLNHSEIDAIYDLPYTRKIHPRYKSKSIPAYDMIKFSVNTHRGCFGSCAFCTISAHQGKFVQSRSLESIIKEVHEIVKLKEFKGTITDMGGPSANMYEMRGKDQSICLDCRRFSCVSPLICNNLNTSHLPILKIYREISKVKGVKHAFVGSGIRYDLFLNSKGYLDSSGKEYFEDVVFNRTSGRLKVAPEHTEEHVLKLMGKPKFDIFKVLKSEFNKIVKRSGKRFLIAPYFISSHPGCTVNDMRKLSQNPLLQDIRLDQVQDFTPTPLTRSSVSFYTGIDPLTKNMIFVERNPDGKIKQKSFFFNKK